jgi:hypothetical protein
MDDDQKIAELSEAVRLDPNNAASVAALAKVKAEAHKAAQPKEAAWFNSNDDVPVVMLEDTKAKAAGEKARAEGDWITELTGDGAGFRQEKNGRAMTLSVKGNSMVGFVKSAFRSFFGVFLWIILILCAIAGGVIGSGMTYGDSMDSIAGAFIGGIVGLIVGLLTDIIGGGLIATILSMDENLEYLANKMKGTYKI